MLQTTIILLLLLNLSSSQCPARSPTDLIQTGNLTLTQAVMSLLMRFQPYPHLAFTYLNLILNTQCPTLESKSPHVFKELFSRSFILDQKSDQNRFLDQRRSGLFSSECSDSFTYQLGKHLESNQGPLSCELQK